MVVREVIFPLSGAGDEDFYSYLCCHPLLYYRYSVPILVLPFQVPRTYSNPAVLSRTSGVRLPSSADALAATIIFLTSNFLSTGGYSL